jgi:hypothetical protein
MTNSETTNASFTSATGKLDGTPFGTGTGVFTIASPTRTDFVLTFDGGTIKGMVTGSRGSEKPTFTSGTGTFSEIAPTPFEIEVLSVSGRTVNYRFTGSIRY